MSEVERGSVDEKCEFSSRASRTSAAWGKGWCLKPDLRSLV